MAITWTNTIKGQFNQYDIDHMKQITGNSLKLDDYQSVKTWAGQIWVQVNNGYMPPGAPWNATYKQNFQTWMNSGMPESDADVGAAAAAAAAVTWTNTIKGQFTQLDITHMKQVSGGSIDLSNYASVKNHAGPIFGMVSRHAMPPGNPWSSHYIQNFQAWMNAGMPEGGSAKDAASVTWTNTIKGQFTQLDITHMKQVSGGSIDLSSYASVKSNGNEIFAMVNSKAMPPGNPWSPQYIQNFQAWMNAGYPQ
jgi:hypothetical protein